MGKSRAALPLKPLWDIARAQADDPGMSVVEFAHACRTTERAVTRWRSNGMVPWISADEAAVALGLHPMLVWGNAWLNVKDDFDRLAEGIVADLEDDVIADLIAEGLS
jgi:hypothetical protein